MADDQDLIGLAGEYALGTLDAGERLEAHNLMQRDPAFAASVRTWEGRLAAFSAGVKTLRPPNHVRGAVLRRIAGESRRREDVVGLRRQMKLWRGTAVTTGVLASGLAAALAAFLIIEPTTPPSQGRYVAVLQTEGPGPAFVATIDVGAGTVSVRRVAAEPQPGKSYELWAVGGGRDKPRSLGLIDAGARIDAARLGQADSAALAATVFAVSLEPQGGSPTGQPTGPVLFKGKLVATE